MRNMIRKLLLAAAVLSLCMGAAFPALAAETAQTTQEMPPAQEEGSHSVYKAGTRPSTLQDGYVDAGPGAKKKEDKKEDKKEAPKPKETSLGQFTITGYCGCDHCSGTHNLTYSGVVPTANHTISADLNLFPLGTKLKIDGITYTVEDKGSAVKGKTLDIYYDTHEEALARGRYTTEVFLVE